MSDIKQFNAKWEYYKGGTITIGVDSDTLISVTNRRGGGILPLEINYTENGQNWEYDEAEGVLSVNKDEWIFEILEEDNEFAYEGDLRIMTGGYVEYAFKISDRVEML